MFWLVLITGSTAHWLVLGKKSTVPAGVGRTGHGVERPLSHVCDEFSLDEITK